MCYFLELTTLSEQAGFEEAVKCMYVYIFHCTLFFFKFSRGTRNMTLPLN